MIKENTRISPTFPAILRGTNEEAGAVSHHPPAWSPDVRRSGDMRTIRTPQPSRNIPGAYELVLPSGEITVFDEQDVPLIECRRWFAESNRMTRYVVSRLHHQPRTQMHRLIMQPPPDMVVDHIDGDGLNNRRENLRICTPAQNRQNLIRAKFNPHGYRGVTWCKARNRFVAQIRHNNRIIYLGMFRAVEDAAMAYDEAARRIRGPFARVNFPREGEQQA